MQHSHLVQSSAFSEMFPGRKPLPVQRHSIESLFNPEWCSTVFGSWPSKTLGSWAVSQGEKERKRVRKERKKERERGLHRRPTSPSPVPAMKDYVSSVFIFCLLHPCPVYLSVSLYSSFSHRSYQIPITQGHRYIVSMTHYGKLSLWIMRRLAKWYKILVLSCKKEFPSSLFFILKNSIRVFII